MSRPPSRSWSLGGLSVRELALRVWGQLGEDDVFARAAQLAYFFVFSLFPLLLFLLSLLGYLVEGNLELRRQVFDFLREVMPTREAYSLVHDTVREIQSQRSGSKLSLGLILSVWAASLGMAALISALNRAFHQAERRPWWKHRLMALGLTIVLSGLLAVSLVVVFYGHALGQQLADRIDAGGVFVALWTAGQWLFLVLGPTLAFDLVYDFAPNLPVRHRRWLTPGAVTAVALWLAGSLGFRTYFSYFDTFSRTYGSLGGMITLLAWFYLTGFAMLLGGEINSEIIRAEQEARARGGEGKDGSQGPGKDEEPEDQAVVSDREPAAEPPVVAGDVV